MIVEERNILEIKDNYLELGKLFMSVMDGFSQGVLITNLENKIIYSNFKVAQLTGFKRNELLGKTADIFLTYPKKHKKLNGLVGLKGTGVFESHEVFLRKKSGECFIGHAITSAFRDSLQKLSGTITILSEVRLNRKDHELNAIALAAAKSENAISILSKFGRIEWVNEGFIELTGYELYEVIDKGFDALENKYFNSDHEEKIAEVLRTKGKTTFQWSGIKKNGDPYWVLRSITPNLDSSGDVKELVIIDTDITYIREEGVD